MAVTNPWSTVHFPGSSGYVAGDRNPSYTIAWDPVNRAVRSNDPRVAGYDPFGRLKSASVVPSAAAMAQQGGNPYAQILSPTTGYAPPASTPTINMGGSAAPRAELLGTGYNPTAAPGQGYNPFFTVANTKSPELATEINRLLGDMSGLRALNPTDAISTAMSEKAGDYQRFLSEDVGAVDDWYDGDVAAALKDLRAQRSQAYANATDRSMDELSRVLALNQMAMGGAGTVGTGSYLTKQALDTAANLEVQRALDDAQQGRADYGTLLEGQQRNLGVRSGLTTQDIQRQLLPSQVGADWMRTLIQSFAPLANLQLGNTFYGLGGGQGGTTIPNISGTGGLPFIPIQQPPMNSPMISPYGTAAMAPQAAPQLGTLDRMRQDILAGDPLWAEYLSQLPGVIIPNVAQPRTSYF